MRISDWSSDVCSSDLQLLSERRRTGTQQNEDGREAENEAGAKSHCRQAQRGGITAWSARDGTPCNIGDVAGDKRQHARRQKRDGAGEKGRENPDARSEEHTSELQSLMRISYAVFCLKKKKKNKQKVDESYRRSNENMKIYNSSSD